MFLGEPSRSPYDLYFQLGPFPVRISPLFWLVAALLGYSWCDVIDQVSVEASPGKFVLLLLWISAVFVSLLIHELGHAVAMRYFGSRAHIVLYHFGGLAIPDSDSWGVSMMRRHPLHDIVISAAGPAAQLLLALLVFLGIRLSGHQLGGLPGLGNLESYIWLDRIMPVADSAPSVQSLPLKITAFFIMMPSVFWALLNLVPVYPLDGGQITRNVCLLASPRGGIQASLIVSIVAAVGLAVYAATELRAPFMTMMFAMLAFSSYSTLQAYQGGGGGGSGFGGGGRPW